MKPLPMIAAAALAAGSAQAAPAVQVSDAWCRAAPAGAPSAACYLSLYSSAGDTLVAVGSPAARTGEIHSMDMAGGVMRMRKLAQLPLTAGRAVELKPGGMHLMLIAPKAAVAPGGSVPLVLKFAKAAPVTVKAEVRAAGAPGPAAEHHRR